MNSFIRFFIHILLLLNILFAIGCAKQHSVKVEGSLLTLYYADARAKEVFFASSADHFLYHPAIKGSRNVWEVTIPLQKEFAYFYVVDSMVTVPDCPNTVLDDFGSINCMYVQEM